MATIRDVARLAETSVASVSKVLNNREIRITPEKRARIIRAAKELNYVPNKTAANLKRGEKDAVAIMVPDLTESFYPKLAKCMMRVLAEMKKRSIIFDYSHDPAQAMQNLISLRDQSVDGVIFIADGKTLEKEHLPEIQKVFDSVALPIVLVGSRDIVQNVRSVSLDNYAAGRMATEHLLSLGHKKIGFIATDDADPIHNGFYRGYVDCMRELMQEDLIIRDCMRYDGGFYAGKELIEKGATAIVAQNDQLALGAISYALRNKISVPEDLSVVGKDDLTVGRVYPVPLTTIRQSAMDISKETVDLLRDQMQQRTRLEGKIVLMPPRLMLRDSTGEACEKQQD